MFRLNTLWSRPSWLSYFAVLVLVTTVTFMSSSLLASLLASRASYSPLPSPTIELRPSRPAKPNAVIGFFKNVYGAWTSLEKRIVLRLETLLARSDDARVTWLEGVGWAVTGGSLAGMCLVFTKAIMKILWLNNHPAGLKPT